jgi:hypothetical protein
MTNFIRNIWDNLTARIAVLTVTLGWVPALLLGKAHAALIA